MVVRVETLPDIFMLHSFPGFSDIKDQRKCYRHVKVKKPPMDRDHPAGAVENLLVRMPITDRQSVEANKSDQFSLLSFSFAVTMGNI